MKAFDLDLYNQLVKEDKTPRLVTRSGKSVKLVCVDKRGKFPLVGLIDNGATERGADFTKDGYFEDQPGSDLDLFFADIEPTIRPYKDAEECFKDAVKHGGWMKDRHINSYYQVATIRNDRISYMDDVYETFQEMLDENVWADDGSPCGVKEE